MSIEFVSVPGEVFCFMPLSFTSGLPVHVNGNFAVLSNRRGLWEEGIKYYSLVSVLELNF